MCERGHGHADSGPVLLRDEPHGDGAGVGARLAAGLRLPADGAGHQRPGRMGESEHNTHTPSFSLFPLFFYHFCGLVLDVFRMNSHVKCQ